MGKQILSDVPKCPNHGEPLLLGSADKGKLSGESACPISMCLFKWAREGSKKTNKLDKFGNTITEKIYATQDEGQET